jgi:hypothetical protein
MTGVLTRAASLVVEPRPAAEPLAASPSATRALVLGTPADAPSLAASLAGSLRALEKAAAAVLCLWAPTSLARWPTAWTSAGARRLAARLAARELEVRAAGRLAWVWLPAEPAEAALVLSRMLGWLDAPIVTVLAGPRAVEHDALVTQHDLVVAVRPAAGGSVSASGADALAALALDGIGEGAVAVDPIAAGPARWRARAGLGRLPASHPAVAVLGRNV